MNESEKLEQAWNEFINTLLDTAIGKFLIKVVELINKALTRK